MTEPNGDHTQPAPGDSGAVQLYDQARALAEQGQQAQSIELCDQALAQEPDMAMALQLRALLAIRDNDHAGAGVYFEKLAKAAPDSADAWFNLGNARYQTRQYEQAIEAMDRSLALAEHARALTLKGLSLRELDRPEEARACLEHALDQQADYLPAMASLATLRQQAGEHEEAIALFRRVVEFQPELAPSHVNLGSALLESGAVEEAADAYRSALTLDHSLTNARLGLARIAEARGLVDEAVSHLRRILRRRPDSAAVAGQLAQLLIKHEREPEALLVLEQALQHNPGNETLQALHDRIRPVDQGSAD